MLTLPLGVRVFLAREPVDMRKSFDGLFAVTRDVLRQDPFAGHLFVFLNRNRDRVKVLVWDQGGFWLLYKRLEAGTFALPEARPGDQAALVLDRGQFLLFLEQISVERICRRRHYSPHGYQGADDPGRSLPAVRQ